MPIYEYKCLNCQETFEVMQKFSDQPLAVHDKCGGTVERLLSSPALQFKGSGWYITDYAKGGGKSSGNGSGKEQGGDTKTESKSDSSSTAKSDSTSSAPAKSN
jgi:putative FmdB family regulatory protein